jgi:hypothetical protein
VEEKFSIQPYLNDVQILNQTAGQIKKELGFFQIEIILIGTNQNAYEELYAQILPHIKTLSKENYQKLISLLYRIDISEKQLNAEQRNNDDKSFEEIITHLIIKRCLQKVVLRKLFS